MLAHDSDGNAITPYKLVETFANPKKERMRNRNRNRKRKQKPRRIERFEEDDDEVNESYIDLGSSFLEAYQSLTPKQIERMSTDTRDLMSHQKRLIETLDNLGPVIQGGQRVMEQFKQYFKDEI